MLVQLFTQGGGFVTDADIPDFNEPPHVLVWGARIFRHERDGRYVEAFTYAILPGQERP